MGFITGSDVIGQLSASRRCYQVLRQFLAAGYDNPLTTTRNDLVAAGVSLAQPVKAQGPKRPHVRWANIKTAEWCRSHPTATPKEVSENRRVHFALWGVMSKREQAHELDELDKRAVPAEDEWLHLPPLHESGSTIPKLGDHTGFKLHDGRRWHTKG